jgi:UMF1 family MFS transporter
MQNVELAALERRREQRGWYFYDFANSAFASTVLTLFLGPYLTALAKAAAGADGLVHPFGLAIEPRSFWSYCISVSVIGQVLFLPVVGAIADYGHRKKQLMGVFAYLGAFATMAMYFLEGTRYLAGGLLFILANVSFGCANIIYNSFLNDIATPEERDNVSSRGWGLGYLGGGLVLVMNLLLYQNAEKIGISEGMAVRMSLSSAGLWWGTWALIPLSVLRNRFPQRTLAPGQNLLAVGIGQLVHTVRDLRLYPETLKFLVAYLLYNDAVQSIIALAGQFGSDELGIRMGTLTLAILMVQFVAFGGAMAFNQLAQWMTARKSILFALVIWTGVLIYAYAFVRSTGEFFVLSGLVGFVMGGTQALSRSTYSLMIPKGREAEYFALYEVSDRGTSWIGPLVFGLAMQFTRSYRVSILSLIVFFIAGFLILWRVNVERAYSEAQR